MPTASHTIALAAEPGETPVTVMATVITMECKQERDSTRGRSAPDVHPRPNSVSQATPQP